MKDNILAAQEKTISKEPYWQVSMPGGCVYLPNTCSLLPPSQCFSTFSDHDFYSIDPEVDADQLRKVSSYQHPDHREEVRSRKVRSMRAEVQF